MPISTREKLTNTRIETLARRARDEGKPMFLWDTGEVQRGLGVRASPMGKRGQTVSWIVQRWVGGEHQQASIGEYPAMTLDEAVSEAQARLRDRGTSLSDKNRERRAQEKANAEAATLGATVERYLVEYPLDKPDNEVPRARYWKEVRQTLERELVGREKGKGLGADTKVKDIQLEDLMGLIKAKQQAGAKSGARNLFKAMQAFFNWCVGERMFKDTHHQSPLAGYAKQKRPKASSRKHDLWPEEIKALWKATEANEFAHPYFRLLLLTAQRREEVAGMHLSEIRNASEWHIPGKRTKNGKDHIVHLSALALAEIARCKPINGYVFPATPMVDKHGHQIDLKRPYFSGYAKPKRRLDKALGDAVRPWRVHDLRRTAASLMQDFVQPHVIEKVLNHELQGVAKVYQQNPLLSERKAALEAWSAEVERIATGKAPANNVHPFRGTGAA